MWIAEYRREPWGEARIDLAAGIVASTVANVHRGGDVSAFRPSDFMPYAERPAEVVEPEKEFDFMTYIETANGGLV